MNSRKPKVVMLAAPIHPIPPRHGAAVEWWMYQTARHLTHYEPHIISVGANGYPAQEQIDGVNFHRISVGPLYKRLFQKLTKLDPLPYSYRASRIIQQLAPDIVHVHNAAQLYVDLLRYLGRGGPHPILHMHNEKHIPALVDPFPMFVVSRYLQGWYAQRQPQAIIQVITNGADMRHISPMREDRLRAKLRERLGVPLGKKVILFVGRISPEKGVLDLVLAFKELLAHRKDMFLLLVGEFSERRRGAKTSERAVYGERIKAECRNMAGFCHYTGSVDPTSIQDYYHAGDLVVIPSEFEEPLCMVAIEAMAAGVPVLASHKGGLPELIDHGKTGFFIESPKVPENFAAQLHRLIDQTDTLREVAAEARQYVEKHHDWDEVARQTEEAYNHIRSHF